MMRFGGFDCDCWIPCCMCSEVQCRLVFCLCLLRVPRVRSFFVLPLCHSATLSLLPKTASFSVIQWINGCPLEPFSVTDPTMFRNKFFLLFIWRAVDSFVLFGSDVKAKQALIGQQCLGTHFRSAFSLPRFAFFFFSSFSSLLSSTRPLLDQTWGLIAILTRCGDEE